MEEKIINQENAGNLQQMKEDMKLHIAQLKAELANVDREEFGPGHRETLVPVASDYNKDNLSEGHGSLLTSKRDLDCINFQNSVVEKSPEKQSSLIEKSEMISEANLQAAKGQNDVEKKIDAAMLSMNSGGTEGPAELGDGSAAVGAGRKEKLRIGEDSRKRNKTSSYKASSLSSGTANSSPRSLAEHSEDVIPVRYLQMSSASPKLMKKNRGPQRNKKSSSTPSSARGTKSEYHIHSRPGQKEESEISKVKYEELEAKLMKLQMQCEVLAEENIKMKKEERAKAVEKISSLKKNNAELANIARKLEGKARILQEQNVKKSQELSSVNRELQQHKRHHQRLKARWESERARSVVLSNDELTAAKAQVEDLKRAIRQIRREKLMQKMDGDSGTDALSVKHKETLRLQKLAAAAGSKVIVRSLSTPVTARQKILEDANRGLRRQLGALESRLNEAESKVTLLEKMEAEMKSSACEKESLQETITDNKSTIMLLEAELQHAKVEASDVGVRLNEMRHVHNQLQEDYSTVHEQLSVAIHERDQAVMKAVEGKNQIAEMQQALSELHASNEMKIAKQKEAEELLESKIKNERKIAAEYREENQTLEKRVLELEGRLLEGDNEKAEMKEKLTRLVQWSKSNSPPDGNSDTQSSKHGCGSETKKSNESSGAATSPLHYTSTPHTSSSSSISATDESLNRVEKREGGSPVSSKGRKLFVAKYSYDPYQGPNEHPEFELPLAAGEYIYINGAVDEDGFYEGELINGRRGLVPSNFVESMEDVPAGVEDVEKLIRRTKEHDDVEMPSGRSATHLSSPPGGGSLQGEVPPPTDLEVLVQPPHNLEAKWRAPLLDNQSDDLILYHVILNGRLATVVNSNSCNVVLENSFNEQQVSHVVSVCSMTNRGRSDPGHCVFTLISSGLPPVIGGVLCEHKTTETARISWRPLDSALTYKISIGEVEEEVTSQSSHYCRQILVPRPSYQHTIHGMKPATLYEVVVKANHSKRDVEAKSKPFRFRTLSCGPPEPPLSVQVEESSTHTIVSWIPVTLNERGTSNGLRITGYQVFINDGILATCSLATTDQVEVDKGQFARIVVATVTADATYQLPGGGFQCLPSVMVRGRTVAEGGQVSDYSAPFYLSPDFIRRLADESGEIRLNDPRFSPPVNQSRGGQLSPSVFDSFPVEDRDLAMVPYLKNKPKTKRRKGYPPEAKRRSKSWSSPDNEKVLRVGSPPQSSEYGNPAHFSYSDRMSSSEENSSRSEDEMQLQGRKKTHLVRRRSHSPPLIDERKVDLRPPATSSTPSPVGQNEATVPDVTSMKNSPVSLYVALFDYNPTMMSPNSDCYQDELPFSEGQLIKVHGGLDDDGFLVGEDRQGRRGFVPGNMVAAVEVDDPSMLDELFDRGFLSTSSPQSIESKLSNMQEPDPAKNDAVESAFMLNDSSTSRDGAAHQAVVYRALYDYDPREASPNIDSEIELTFARGNLINIYGSVDEDGFFRGELYGQYGLVPSNFVQRLSDSISPERLSDPTSPARVLKEDPMITSSTTSTASSEKTKKRGMFSKGKRLFRRLGSAEKPRK